MPTPLPAEHRVITDEQVTNAMPDGSRFFVKRGQRVVNFIERVCVHTKGIYAGKPFILDPYEKQIVLDAFSVIERDDDHDCWIRTYNTLWVEVARKNGKSELMAALGLYMLIADGEQQAEVYGAAGARDQAGLVFMVIDRMIELSPALQALVGDGQLEVIKSRKRVIFHPTASFYQVISADAGLALGSNPHCVLFDEVLTQPSRDLWDALTQGFGTRLQPMIIAATTAGNNRLSFCYAEHEFGLRVARDPNLDRSRYVFIRSIPADADWEDERNWYIANPALGSFLSLRVLRNEYTAAKNSGDLKKVAAFRQFRCNQWQRQTHRWLDMSVWEDNFEVNGDFEDCDVAGLPCYAGYDQGESDDFTAWVLIWVDEESGKVYVRPRFWLPRESVEGKHKRIKEFLVAWEAQGHLSLTDGTVVDYETIIADVLADVEAYGLRMLGYDPANATALIAAIENRTDVVCVKIPQTTTRMNAPSRELTRLLGRRLLVHGNNPVLTWMADNVEATADSEGHIKPSKRKSPEKIDGVTALVNGLANTIDPEEEAEVGFWHPDAETWELEEDDDL